MSIEKALADLTAAVKENTAAHLKLAEVATAAQGAKAPAKATTTKAPAKAKAEEKKADTPAPETEETEEAPKKQEAKKPASRSRASTKKKAPEPSGPISFEDLKKAAKAFISPDDEAERDANKEKLGNSLDHLGAESLGKVDEEDRPKVATYIAYWSAGLEVDFEEIDALVAEASEGGDEQSESDDDMLD